ncbi:HotDog domain-containing protein [Tricharina praecox]|uniref:HotDog domain-containing protein n=1 Tax=Tricharina praecox TaxID=43433 RepID=UPI0022204115|nr:HotDog domain-containing protein [Tricharina praecox]KAI5853946.1 HotDog domain-containing protein [Tricharina praecox]
MSSRARTLLLPSLYAVRLGPARRQFSAIGRSSYDGVYKELQIMKLKMPWLQALAEAKAAPASAAATTAPQEKKELVPKRMSDSYHELVLPLANDQWLVDTYINSSGNLRLGALFQDLDALAGVISYKHTGEGITIVTAAVDRISIINPLDEWCDLHLSGYVSYVGSSSMEVSLEARRVDTKSNKPVPGQEGLLLTCAFTMVARDPATKKAIAVNPLLVETAEEKEIFRRGEAYKCSKKALAKVDLAKQTPNDEESDLIHQMWMEQSKYKDPLNAATKPENTIYMSTTTIQSTMIMQPQFRNRHQLMIFGGYLMRQTMELAFCCCSAFAHTRPTFVSLDPSTFLAPVPVGSILYLTATVAYTEPGSKGGSRVQVRVQSKVRDVEHGKVVETGVFNYTFYVDKDLQVMPVTYSEFIDYIDARRRAKQIAQIAADDGTKKRVTE